MVLRASIQSSPRQYSPAASRDGVATASENERMRRRFISMGASTSRPRCVSAKRESGIETSFHSPGLEGKGHGKRTVKGRRAGAGRVAPEQATQPARRGPHATAASEKTAASERRDAQRNEEKKEARRTNPTTRGVRGWV